MATTAPSAPSITNFGKCLASALATGDQQLSELQKQRLLHPTEVPKVLQVNHALTEGDDRAYKLNNDPDATRILDLFPHLTGDPHLLHLVHLKQDDQNQAVAPAAPLRLGVVFSGGQAAGGHNVLAGLFDFLQRRHPGSTFLGFLDGPRGVMEGRYKELTRSEIDRYRNLGGFHCLGSGRDKIEKSLDLARAAASCESLDLDGLVIVGGDDSNTNAAVLAEHFLSLGAKTRVVGVPKTLDGDLKNGDVSISFGFDTACKVYSELIGNIMIDAASARKYWHFVRLMGRAASHVTLECALQTHPQWSFISEEIAGSHTPISQVAAKVADLVQQRAAQGKKYGVILLPEGLVEYVPDVAALISELNEILFKQQAANGQQGQPLEQSAINAIAQQLTPASRTLFDSLSVGFQRQFLEDRDPHGNVQVSHIETEKLLIRLVEAELEARAAAGTFKGKFNGVGHFFGYEGRCALPSNFDATYCYALGQAAAALTAAGRTGIMATVSELHLPASEWRVGGTPLVTMMCMEHRSGKDKPVIRKALVDLNGAPINALRALRDHWAANDCFRSPGPVQFRGHAWADVGTITLALEVNGGDPIMLTPTPDV